MINIKNLNKFNRNDEGVSPVIGVILMVAATIVIAGVIMAMLGGFAPVQPPRSVSIPVTHYNTTHLLVVFHGGPDGAVNRLNISIDGEVPRTIMNETTAAGVLNPIRIGNRTIVSGATPGSGNDHVILVARFTDGVEQVVLDTSV